MYISKDPIRGYNEYINLAEGGGRRYIHICRGRKGNGMDHVRGQGKG